MSWTKGALAGTGWQLDRTWVLLFAGVGVFWLADSLYLVGNANGTYVPGSWFDIGWWLGLLLIGAAAWQPAPPARAAAADERVRRIVVPLTCGSAGLGLLALLIRAAPFMPPLALSAAATAVPMLV